MVLVKLLETSLLDVDIKKKQPQISDFHKCKWRKQLDRWLFMGFCGQMRPKQNLKEQCCVWKRENATFKNITASVKHGVRGNIMILTCFTASGPG